MTAQATITLARNLMNDRDEGLVGVWSRAVAFLSRQALEESVGDVLAARAAGTERCSAKAQLLCLETYAPADAAREASYLWSILSRACHCHPYELAPTFGELVGWLDRVEVLEEGLWRSAPRGASDGAVDEE